MIKRHSFASFVLLTLAVLGTSPGHAGDLTFAERVAAQAAIERVYYAHQDGTVRPFEEAFPRELLERKVVKYLKQSAALEEFWNTPVTAEMLERELQRMASGTRLPERLRQLFAALDDDPVRIRECLARATLVDRLSRNFFAYDPRFHAAARREMDALHAALANSMLDPWQEHPRRTEIELTRAPDEGGLEELPPSVERGRGADGAKAAARFTLSPSEFDDWRRRVPDAAGEVRPAGEDREAFHVRLLLEGDDDWLRVVTYRVEKTRWDTWWRSVAAGLDEDAVATVAAPHTAGPVAIGNRVADGFLDAPCADDDTWDNGSLDDMPDARSRHASVWTGSHLLVWGGWDGTYLGSGGRYDPATDTWAAISTVNAPSSRRDHTAVWTGDRMLVWGGHNAFYEDTGGRYDPVADSWAPIATVNAPEFRSEHTAIWTGSRMVIWGGYGNTYWTTGGRYDPVANTWEGISTTNAPSPRSSHSVVWTGARMLVWGGHDAENYLGTGGRYDPVNDVWGVIQTSGAPSPRHGHTAVWAAGRMLIWGGFAGDGGYPETGGRYVTATNSWTPISTTDAPTPRYRHTAVWTGSQMLVWGGYGGAHMGTGGRYDPVADTWTPTSDAGAPAPRYRQTAAWTGSLMLVWGGNDNEAYMHIGGRYDPAADTWTAISSAGAPSPRYWHTTVWTGSHMLVWGGWNDVTGTDSGGRYDPATDSWTATALSGAPAPRDAHVAVWTGSQMLIWGGYGGGHLDTGGRYDPVSDSWTAISTDGAPAARDYLAAVWTGSRMLVWGGWDGSVCLDTGGSYDPVGDNWVAISTAGVPSARARHTAVWTGSRMLVWGGWDGTLYFDTGGQYDPEADTWAATSTMSAPLPRKYHAAIWTGSRMLVWGGWDGTLYFDTGGQYDPGTDTWAETSTEGAPSARSLMPAVWTGSLVLIWGGWGDSGSLGNGARYDPATDTWAAISNVGAAAPRSVHSAVWTGSFMLVWGGYDDGPLSGGGRYALGHASDDDGDGYSECDGDCNDGNPAVYAGAPEICDGFDNQCPGDPGHGQLDTDCDGDGDGYCDAGRVVVGRPSTCPGGGDDCDDDDPDVFPGAPEVNDGLDNQCPGDRGHGVTDEISGAVGYHNPGDGNEFSWQAQAGATSYEVARSTMPDFSSGCTFQTTAGTAIATEDPVAESAHHYLVRPVSPHLGSWGQDSQGQPRVLTCSDDVVAAVNFQPDGAEVPDGHDKDWGQLFDSGLGHGWDVSMTGNTRDRGVLTDQALDTFIFSQAARRWDLTLADGVYVVWVTSGDASYQQGPQQTVVEDVTIVSGETTAAGSFLVTAVCVDIVDGDLTIEIGGLAGNTILNSARVESGACTPGEILDQETVTP